MSVASIKQFLHNNKSGKTQTQKHKIYNFIKRNPKCTIADIEFYSTGMKSNTVSARLSDLLDLGVVKIVGTFESKESTYSELVIVEDVNESLTLLTERKKNNRTKVIMQLLNNHKNALKQETVELLMSEV